MVVLLTSFPSELLSLICKFVDPEDFASFSILNRRFQAIAEPFKKHHHEQWNKYAVLRDRPNTSYQFWHNVLRSVLEGWEGAKYVRILKVRYAKETSDWDLSFSEEYEYEFTHDWDFEECREVRRLNQGLMSDVHRVPREHRQLIIEALKDVPWFANHGLDQVAPELHKTSLILALLVSRLPNLQTLAIARHSSSKLYHLHNAVSHAALSLSVPGARYGPLSHLKEVDFNVGEIKGHEFPGYCYNVPGCFEPSFLLPFLSLPSIESLKAAHIVGQMSSEATNLPQSKLEYLNLRALDIPSNALSSILERSTNLRSCELTTGRESESFSVVAAIDALLSNASKTLEELTLLADLSNPTTDRYISLAGFNALVYIDITYDCLGLPPTDPTGVISLTNALPASLKTLKIRAHAFREGLARNILALLTKTPPKQAKLKCLSVETWLDDEDRKAMRQVCQLRNIRSKGDIAVVVLPNSMWVS